MPACHIYFVVNPSFRMLLSKLSNRNTRVYIQYQNDQFFLPFSVYCSQVVMLQIMPALCPHGQGEGVGWGGGGGDQPNVDRPGHGEGGGPKNSQISADILYG